MISWRNIAVDLKLLSNGVLLYAIFYAMGFFAYFSQLGDSQDKFVVLSIPLLAISLCVLTHIANERADKVADQIVLEHGGYRRRLVVRMISVLIYNTLLVTAGFLIIQISHGWNFQIPNLWALTAAASIIIFSTAGVIVSGAFPHPIASVVLTLGLLFAGGLSPNDAYQASSFIGMISSRALPQWFGHFWPFAVFWFAAAILALPLAVGRRLFARRYVSKQLRTSNLEIASWVTWPSNFATRTLISATTNWLPLLALLVALSSYTFSTFLIAAKYAELKVTGSAFAIFPGLILTNILPAILLAKSVQRTEVDEQESFLFASQSQALRSRFAQKATFVTLVAMLLVTALALLTNTSLSTPIFIRSILVTSLASPGITAIGLLIGSRFRSTPAVGLVSFLLTLPEFLVSKFWPQGTSWLPSSIFSALAGGPGPFVRNYASIPDFWVALTVAAIVFAGPLWRILFYSPLKSMMRRIVSS